MTWSLETVPVSARPASPCGLRRHLLGLAIVSVLVVAGCGGNSGDKRVACTNIEQEMQHLAQTGMQQVSDPAAFARTYSDGAAAVRSQGDRSGDAEVRATANRAASALQSLGEQVGSGGAELPDSGPLIQAGADLKAACS